MPSLFLQLTHDIKPYPHNMNKNETSEVKFSYKSQDVETASRTPTFYSINAHNIVSYPNFTLLKLYLFLLNRLSPAIFSRS